MQAEKPQKCTSVRPDFTEISVSVVISTQFEFGAAIRGALFSVSLRMTCFVCMVPPRFVDFARRILTEFGLWSQ